MKLLAIYYYLFFLIPVALAQKDPICRDEPDAKGKCEQILSGFTFSRDKNECTPYAVSACRVVGNYFETRLQCEQKCRGDFSWNNFLITYYRSMFKLRTNFRNFLRRDELKLGAPTGKFKEPIGIYGHYMFEK